MRHSNTARSPQAATTNSFTEMFGANSRYIALLAAWVATCGSLFFSEALGWAPCLLCWYQRILMYPLGIILAVGILRRDSKMHLYVLPLSLLGICVSLYHYLLIKTPWLPEPACSLNIPCNVDYLNWLGFINIPFLALTAFIVISAMMLISRSAPFTQEEETPRFGLESGLVFGIIGIVVIWFVAAARLIG